MNLKKMISRGVAVSTLALSFQTAGAGMIGAETAAQGGAQTDRAMVLEVLARADTTSRLEAMGVDPSQARDRVAAMSDQEVTQLVSHIREAPAGAVEHRAADDGHVLADGGTVLLVVVALAAVWYYGFRR